MSEQDMGATEVEVLKHIDDLEQLELQDPGRFEEPQHIELLTLYIFTNQLDYAKLLCKRSSYKTNQTMAQLNAVCQSLAKRDWVRVHSALDHSWPDNILNLINELKGKIRERILYIIQQAYTSIPLGDVSQLLATPSAELHPLLASRGWSVDSNAMVVPVASSRGDGVYTCDGESTLELARLTRIISYVENQ